MTSKRQPYQPAFKVKDSRNVVFATLGILFFMGFSSSVFSQAWFNTSWGYRKAITINFSKVPNTDQANFPVEVSLAADAGLSAHALGTGNDILFTLSDGTTKIPYQRESYSAGTLLAWVNVPVLSHTANTVIYMYYGNSLATDQQQATSAWDANYKLVYHLGDAGSPAADATINSNNGTQSGGVVFGATGQIGKATTYGAAGRSISAAASPGIGATGNFTYEVWINVSAGYTNNTNTASANGSYWIDRAVATNALISLMPAGNKFGWQVRDDNGNNIGGPNTGAIATGTWQHIVLVRDITNNVFRQYQNGVLQTTFAFSGALPLTPPIPKLGSHATFGSPAFLNGSLDEFRISANARSADWIATEYNNQSSPSTFYSLAAETPQPAITSFSPSNGCVNTASVIIAGVGFTGATAVKFGGTDALSFIVNSNTQITAIPANGTTGTISVTTPNGTGTSASIFTVNQAPAAFALKTDITCFNAGDGTITVSGSGGSGVYTGYSISNGLPLPVPNGYQASPAFNALSPGQYKIRVIDDKGCESKPVQ